MDFMKNIEMRKIDFKLILKFAFF